MTTEIKNELEKVLNDLNKFSLTKTGEVLSVCKTFSLGIKALLSQENVENTREVASLLEGAKKILPGKKDGDYDPEDFLEISNPNKGLWI